ncbi:substrate-binding domain-containing protein [Pelagibacterium lacus]|uniref:Periplasmic binding protein domain-containing protein n=1 Tax=Pelagibacterium lacus TaxID=2282655 RepID=A0A369W2D5_9HYPH|nr:substrate-binding domain-containing protein [Pelagibacterium lacus]RDE08708.1 hypothetical protein DVH29_10470 [Pelagibacterium lacus]
MKLAVVLSSAGPELKALVRALTLRGKNIGVQVGFTQAKQLKPIGLADALNAALDEGVDAIAFQALDHPAVRDVVLKALSKDVRVVALLSPLDGLEGSHYVGLNNRSAGRTAGALMSSIVREQGTAAVMWSGYLFRAHELRESAFRSVMRSAGGRFFLSNIIGYDDEKRNYKQVLKFLDEFSDLIGIYSVGGGHVGIVNALAERGLSKKVKLIVHNLTPDTRRLLLSDEVDFVLHPDMEKVAEKTLEVVTSANATSSQNYIPIEIITKENIEDRGLTPDYFEFP